MEQLTRRQAQVLAFIKKAVEDNGYTPTLVEIATHFDFSSPNAAADHLKALACVARLLRDPGLVAALRATRNGDALYSLMAQQSKPHAACTIGA